VTGCSTSGTTPSSSATNSVNFTALIAAATTDLQKLESAYTQFKPQIEAVQSLIAAWKAQQSSTQSVSAASSDTNCASCSDKPAPYVRRRAVVCGLDRLDAAKWNGWVGDCPGALLDQQRKEAQLRGLGYEKVIALTNNECTKYGFVAAAIFAADGLRPGDLLFIFASGHTGQKSDINGDESGGKDDFFCLYDAAMDDDLNWELLCKIPDGVRVVLELDTCNSRTLYRGVGARSLHDYASGVRGRIRSARASEPAFAGRLMVVSGCNDGSSSYGNSQTGGNLTYADVRAFKSEAQSYRQWFAELSQLMPRYQIPYMSEVGKSFADYPSMR
jgi:hypothetical protein